MKPEDIQAVELLFIGSIFGIMFCLLYVAISSYVEVKRRNRRHQILLDAGVDPLDILLKDL